MRGEDTRNRKTKAKSSAFRRPSCSASERTSGTEEFRKIRRSKTHGAGLAGDVGVIQKETNAHRESIRVSIRSPANFESENCEGGGGGFC